MKNFLLSIAMLFSLLYADLLRAQDIHFAHIHSSPTLLNPAMTGLFNGDLRLIANYRSQWNSVTNAYKTVAGSVDMQLIQMNNADVIGGGLKLFVDKAGDLDFKTVSASVDLSILKSLDGSGTHFVSFGIQNTLTTNSFDYSKIIAFDDEPGAIDGSPNKINYWDISAGIGWFYSFDKRNSMYLGASLFHINKPNVSFYEQDTGLGVYLDRRIVFHGGGDFKLAKDISLKPSFIFMDQGPHREILLGTFIKYKKIGKHRYNQSPASLHLGAWYRWYYEKDISGSDAFVVAARLDYKNTYVTFSFDINVSSWKKVSQGSGGPELSIIQIIDFDRQRPRSQKVECPAFYY